MAAVQSVEFSLRMLMVRAPIPGVTIHLHLFSLLHGTPFLRTIRLILHVWSREGRVSGRGTRFRRIPRRGSRRGFLLQGKFFRHLIESGGEGKDLRVLGINLAPRLLVYHHGILLSRGRDEVVHCDACVRARSRLIVIDDPLHPII